MSAMLNNQDVPAGLAGKESIIFGNIEDIYNFHNEYVLTVLHFSNFPYFKLGLECWKFFFKSVPL